MLQPYKPLCQGPKQEAPHIVLQGFGVEGMCEPQHSHQGRISFFLEAGVGAGIVRAQICRGALK